MNLFISLSLFILGQAMVWFQLYGSSKVPYLKDSTILLYLVSLPIAFCYIHATQAGIEYFGASWPVRIMTFAIGNIIFFLLGYFLMNETLSLKNAICLGLTLLVILIQIIWK